MLHTQNADGRNTLRIIERGSLVLNTGIDIIVNDDICRTSGLSIDILRQWTHPYRRVYMTDDGLLMFGIYLQRDIDKQII